MNSADLFTDILGALQLRYPGRTQDAYRTAAVRVYFNYEAEGPVTEVDRLFLGGPQETASDADILIERTLLEMRDRDAGIVDASAHADGNGGP